jgi:hypothetical protein
VYSESSQRFYRNGVPVGNETRNGTVGPQPFRIGGNIDNTLLYRGDAQNMTVFNRALTPTEIKLLYTQPLAMIDDSLEINSGFDSLSGLVNNDITMGGNISMKGFVNVQNTLI